MNGLAGRGVKSLNIFVKHLSNIIEWPAKQQLLINNA